MSSALNPLLGHIVPSLEAPPCGGGAGGGGPLPTSPRAVTLRCFPNLPASAVVTGALPARVAALLHERAHGATSEARAVAADTLHALAILNDALGRVLVDADVGVSSSGASVRGMDVLAQLKEE